MTYIDMSKGNIFLMSNQFDIPIKKWNWPSGKFLYLKIKMTKSDLEKDAFILVNNWADVAFLSKVAFIIHAKSYTKIYKNKINLSC